MVQKQPPILSLDARSRSQRVRRVCELLTKEYGRPRFGNPRNPVDDLVYIILSNRTLPNAARNAYKDLKRKFPTWDSLLSEKISAIRKILKPAGLSNIKSEQIKSALSTIKKDFGACSLRRLKPKDPAEIEEYLTALPGVSKKVAKCVMMYTMGIDVLPVDVHVHRIASRLGWTIRKRADQCHDELESLVLPKWRFAFHVDCIAHGRECCFSQKPNCNFCCIQSYCQRYRSES